MPTRLLRDWTDSEPINALSFQAEVLFTRIIMKADDYGRYPAKSRLVRSACMPLKDGVRDADITRWLAECEKAGLIAVYEVGQKSFLEIRNFGQRMRAAQSKYPAPDMADAVKCPSDAGHLRTNDRTCPPDSESDADTESETNTPQVPKGTGIYSPRFEQFWKEYPKRVGKGAAWKSWQRMSPVPPFESILSAIQKHRTSDQWKKDGGQFIPHPATWINQRRWEDDMLQDGSSAPSGDSTETLAEQAKRLGIEGYRE